MFVRAGDRLINLDNVVEVHVLDAIGRDEQLAVDIVTTAVASDSTEDINGYDNHYAKGHEIRLWDAEAVAFLAGISIRSPNGSQTAAMAWGLG